MAFRALYLGRVVGIARISWEFIFVDVNLGVFRLRLLIGDGFDDGGGVGFILVSESAICVVDAGV